MYINTNRGRASQGAYLQGLARPYEPMPTQPFTPTVPPEHMPTTPADSMDWCPKPNIIKSSACFKYGLTEIKDSRSEAGILNPDVVITDKWFPGPGKTLLSCGFLVIRDFGVGWRHLKDSTLNEQKLKDLLAHFEGNPSLVFTIIGYSDCLGSDKFNIFLRTGRARNVARLFGPSARSRINFVGPAPLQTYLTENSTPATRAHNRSAVIYFYFPSPPGPTTI